MLRQLAGGHEPGDLLLDHAGGVEQAGAVRGVDGEGPAAQCGQGGVALALRVVAEVGEHLQAAQGILLLQGLGPRELGGAQVQVADALGVVEVAPLPPVTLVGGDDQVLTAPAVRVDAVGHGQAVDRPVAQLDAAVLVRGVQHALGGPVGGRQRPEVLQRGGLQVHDGDGVGLLHGHVGGASGRVDGDVLRLEVAGHPTGGLVTGGHGHIGAGDAHAGGQGGAGVVGAEVHGAHRVLGQAGELLGVLRHGDHGDRALRVDGEVVGRFALVGDHHVRPVRGEGQRVRQGAHPHAAEVAQGGGVEEHDPAVVGLLGGLDGDGHHTAGDSHGVHRGALVRDGAVRGAQALGGEGPLGHGGGVGAQAHDVDGAALRVHHEQAAGDRVEGRDLGGGLAEHAGLVGAGAGELDALAGRVGGDGGALGRGRVRGGRAEGGRGEEGRGQGRGGDGRGEACEARHGCSSQGREAEDGVTPSHGCERTVTSRPARGVPRVSTPRTPRVPSAEVSPRSAAPRAPAPS